VYVTHDQIEAMTMGDRVAVLRSGYLQQCDSPQVLYETPKNLFVAAFIGSPAMNLYEASITDGGALAVKLGSQTIQLPDRVLQKHPGVRAYAGKDIVIGIRPEHLPAANGNAETPLSGDIMLVEALGSELQLHFEIDAKRVLAEGPTDADELTTSGAGVARVGPHVPARVGEKLTFALEADGLQFFDAESGEAIWG
jgi:multiple sugar transport system ATP-binding protein